MEENNIINSPEAVVTPKESQKQIAGAIIIAGLAIAGAILIKGNSSPVAPAVLGNNDNAKITAPAKVSSEDKTIGNEKAKVTIILYEDFQCPFCGAVSGLQIDTPVVKSLKQRNPTWTPLMPGIMEYVNRGDALFVYRDFVFLGPESVKASEAARCAGDQGKFWQYHDYLFSHQNGENQGNFGDTYLKGFAKTLGLDQTAFDQCLDGGKYTDAVMKSTSEGQAAGVTGTPKGFIMRDGKVIDTIDGAESFVTVKPKIENALK